MVHTMGSWPRSNTKQCCKEGLWTESAKVMVPLLQFAEKGLFSDGDVVAYLDLISSCFDTFMILKEALNSFFSWFKSYRIDEF